MTDAELVAAFVQGGDSRAFEQLARRMQPGVRRLLFSLLNGSPEDIEDTEQEALLALYNTLHRFSGRSSVRTYWYRVVRNVAIDAIRAGSRERRARRELELVEYVRISEAESASDLVEQTAERDKASLFFKVVEALGETDRTALYLFYVEELSIDEVAGVMDVRPGTVKSRLHRARKRIERRIERIGRNDNGN